MIAKPCNAKSADSLFSQEQPFDAGLLPVGDGHRLAYTQRGNPQGIPVIVLHGGPGSGSSPLQASFFDPACYRVIQFDQRGSGLSEPSGETQHNRTELLLGDIETLRHHLGITRWLVVGGSWGATLGAVYAANNRANVTGVLFRGLFLTGEDDIQWFFKDAAADYPEAWLTFSRIAPQETRDNLLPWLYIVFNQGTDRIKTEAATAWFGWERVISGLPPTSVPEGDALHSLVQRYRLQSHYLLHRCWLGESAVLQSCANLSGLPVLFVHGDRDKVCRPQNSIKANAVCPGSLIKWAWGAGHDPFHPAMISAMRAGLDRFSEFGDFEISIGSEN
ncbi:proline iminopeptidase [mine drainage metagenome]|uniref:prolyl aminopeptidase n=1 Tax=mine drainage metagenome TaxID=410659 RepID=A0A1J5S1S6_9ZZZZ